MLDCFAIASQKGFLKTDRVVEYIRYESGQVNISGDFFITNKNKNWREYDYLLVMHPGDVEVFNTTLNWWSHRDNLPTRLLLHMHREHLPNIKIKFDGSIAIDKKSYQLGPLNNPIILSGGISKAGAQFTLFKIGPIIRGDFVVRVQLMLTGKAYNKLVPNAKPGSEVSIFGFDSFADRIDKEQLSPDQRKKFDDFLEKRYSSSDILPDECDVIVYDKYSHRLPDLVSVTNARLVAQTTENTINSLCFTAKGEGCLHFKINLKLN